MCTFDFMAYFWVSKWMMCLFLCVWSVLRGHRRLLLWTFTVRDDVWPTGWQRPHRWVPWCPLHRCGYVDTDVPDGFLFGCQDFLTSGAEALQYFQFVFCVCVCFQHQSCSPFCPQRLVRVECQKCRSSSRRRESSFFSQSVSNCVIIGVCLNQLVLIPDRFLLVCGFGFLHKKHKSCSPCSLKGPTCYSFLDPDSSDKKKQTVRFWLMPSLILWMFRNLGHVLELTTSRIV